jgi:glycosyltransferase involved in cell wall biosynthesis
MGVTVGLSMIVKNEALTLPRLAASVREQIDYWIIVDTGSTDDTVAVARHAFEGVEGEVLEDEWRGFGPSRMVALEAGRLHADWLLLLDADDTFEGEVCRDLLGDDLDGIEAELHHEDLRLWRPFLIRSAANWRWHGGAHEYLSLGEATPSMARTDRFYVLHHADGGNRGDKFDRERALLEADFEEDPTDSRTCFYLARTHDDAGDRPHAAEWYRRRLALGGWDEELWYSRWRLGVCLVAAGATEQGCGVLFDAWGERTWRPEPLWTLATHYRENERWRLCWEVCELARRHTAAEPDGAGDRPDADRLFVHTDVFAWRLAYERSICAYYVGETARGRALCQYLLGRPELPADIRASVEANQRFYDR